MGQVLHGCARTTEVVRRAIQHSQASLNALADQYGINPKTVAKWRSRQFAHDAPMGPKKSRSTVLTLEEEAAIVAFRKLTLLPLDDCLYALQPSLPHLTRSSLHRCLQRHGISRLPEVEGDKSAKKKFKAYPIGYFHIDIAEVQTDEGRLYLFVAIDRTSKFAYAELHKQSDRTIASDFLEQLVTAVPYKIHTVLTDNGAQFCIQPKYRNGVTARHIRHMFDLRCDRFGIEHRHTKPKHPWTNGQVERMNRTIKEATVKRYHYESHEQLKNHLQTFLMAYNFARRLKTLKGLTPYEYICKIWTTEPQRFNINPAQHTVGLNIYCMHKSRMKHNLLCVALLLASPLCHADRQLACRLSLEQTQPTQHCLSLYPEDSPQRTLADGTIHPHVARRLRYDKDGLAVVLTDEAYFYVNRKLKVRSTITFDNGADYFEQGLARTRQNNKIGFFDKSLKIIIPATHTFVFPFENGRAEACDGCITEMIDGGEHSIMTGGTWGWIDRKGQYTLQKTAQEK